MDHLTGLPISNGDMGSQGESSGRSTPNSDSAPGKLFVGGLSWQTSQDKLREYFGQFGNVTDVLVMKDPITQVSVNLENIFLWPGKLILHFYGLQSSVEQSSLIDAKIS